MRSRLAGGMLAFGLLVAIACMVPLRPASAAGTLVQTTNASNGGATSVSVSYVSSVTANNLLVVICGANSAAATITGPAGFTTARNDASTATAPGQGIFYKIASGSESSISCSTSASVSIGIQIYEYSGMAASRPLDATNTALSSGSVGLSAASGNVTTTYANDLLIAGITANGGTTISSWSNSFVQENS
ncbi:MAG TPA: hypothetical protein VFI84_04550, partial [Candidatus Saccharimonadales bacterium]|nr:hypothetical protein [Candidatus Saccharimonadales bacterium]